MFWSPGPEIISIELVSIDKFVKSDEVAISKVFFREGSMNCKKIFHSHFCYFFSLRMLRVKEQGIQKRLWKQVYATKPKCTTRSAFSALTIIDISPAVIILAFGCGFSVIILLLEITFQRYRRQKKAGNE